MRFDLDPTELLNRSDSAYYSIASEYYEPTLHPTCANFDALNDALFPSLLRLIPPGGNWIEVGCGCGRLDKFARTASIVLTDSCRSMLSLARSRADAHVQCEEMDAFRPHFHSGTIQGVFSFLGDPYNHPVFFQHAFRMMSAGATLVSTVPSHQWTVALRSSLQFPPDETVFIDLKGRAISAPSITRDVPEQCDLLASIGFRVLVARSVSLDLAPGQRPSPHVSIAARRMGVDALHAPLLDVFVARKDS